MHSARLGLIGAPSEWLVASSPDPVLVTRVWGPEVVPVEIEEILECLGRVGSRQAAAVKEDFLAGAALVREPSPDDLDRAAAVYVALRQIVDERGLDALTVRCFDLLRLAGTTGCLALSRLNDEGVVAGCEGDLPATLTMMLLSRLCGEPAFMGNPARIDDRAERVWIAHCTVARALVSSYVLRSHFESGIGVAIEGELRTGRVTIARIGGSRLSELLLEPGTVEASGHEEDLCRTQACVRSLSAVVVLLRSPLGNHHVLAYGDWVREAQALAHLARWAVR
jgi:L-fucose isomerase-like protein